MINEEILMKRRDGCMLSLLKHSFDEEIENTEIGCFHQYYDDKLNKEVLIINVDNVGEIKK